jgi:long-chain acyl-CoA synthetase
MNSASPVASSTGAEISSEPRDPYAARPWLSSYPPGIPADIPLPSVSLPGLVGEAARRFPNRAALIFAVAPGVERRWTYEALWRDSGRFASFLVSRGFQKGDRLALYLPNCPQYVLAYLAALRLGLTVVQVSPLYLGQDLVFPLKDSGARGLVTLDILSHHLERVRGEVDLPTVVVGTLREVSPWWARPLVDRTLRRQGQDPSPPRAMPWIPFAEGLRPRPSVPEPDLDPAKDVAVFQYTGGTTGRPKAAMLTHRNLVANALQCRAWFPEGEGQAVRVLAVIPFFHVYGMTVALNYPLSIGATLIVNPQRPEPGLLLKLIDRYRPHQLPGVPAMYNALIHHPDVGRYDLRTIQTCLSGSAPLPVEVAKRFEELTGGHLVEGYGLSEASPVTHANPIQGPVRRGSVGLPLPSTQARIVDLEDPARIVPLGETGELSVRGPQVMLGYWNQPEETASVLRDGWLLTGDVARMDAEGYTYIVDRKKDLILVGGFNVYPREVEEVLYQHPGVAEAAVVGVPDPERGEVVKAFVVPKPGVTLTEREMIDFVRERIAHFKAPRTIEFRSSLPKSLVGKVLRRELRAETPAPRPSVAASPPSPSG